MQSTKNQHVKRIFGSDLIFMDHKHFGLPPTMEMSLTLCKILMDLMDPEIF